jgi:hypothetical protein
MTGFALHGSPIRVEHVPGRLDSGLAPPVLGRIRLTFRNVGCPTFLHYSCSPRRSFESLYSTVMILSYVIRVFKIPCTFSQLGERACLRNGCGARDGGTRHSSRSARQARGTRACSFAKSIYKSKDFKYE